MPALPADTPYFHARYRQALPAPPDGSPYEILSVHGRGHYVGTVLSVVQAEAGWFGEGDDFFYVDGEAKPSIEGTGSEDYFNDAWSLHVDDGPYAGVPVAEGTGLGSRMTAYRWHLADPVPFTRSLRFVMEHAGWTFAADGSVKSAFDERTDLVSSVAFWYQEGIAVDQPPVPYGPARLPQGNASQIEVEASLAEVRAEKGNATLVPDLFWSKDVIHFEAAGPGSRLEVPFDVPEDGDYEVYTQLARGSDYGTYTVLLDGQPPKAPQLEHEPGADVRPQTQIDGYAAETYVGADYQVGWPRLAKGRHTLSYVCLGRNAASSGHNLGVDNIVIARTGAAAWAAAAAVGEPKRPSGSAVELGRALSDSDPVARGLAAMELRARGADAAPRDRRPDGGAAGPGRQRAADVGERPRRDRPRGGACGLRSHRGLLGAERAGPRPAGLRQRPRSDRPAGHPGAAGPARDREATPRTLGGGGGHPPDRGRRTVAEPDLAAFRGVRARPRGPRGPGVQPCGSTV